MTFLWWLTVGLALQWFQGQVLPMEAARPDLRLVLLSFLLLRTDRAPMAQRMLGLLLGLGAGSPTPIGAWFLVVGTSALVVLPLRGLLEVWHPAAQVLVLGLIVGAVRGVSALISLLHESDVALRGPANQWSGLAITALACVVAHPLLVGLSRLHPRWSIPSNPADRRFLREHGLTPASREIDPLTLWHARRR